MNEVKNNIVLACLVALVLAMLACGEKAPESVWDTHTIKDPATLCGEDETAPTRERLGEMML